MQIVDQYFAYWLEYLKPLEDKEQERYLHFTNLLNTIGKRLYGVDFVLAFNVSIFQSLSHVPAGQLSDEN